MPSINDEMKFSAENAILIAKEQYGQDLDFSEQSIARLENVLVKIYWDHSNRTKDEEEASVLYNTALIWGSYLGEYMRLKWGGTWILKGSDPLLSIKNIKFSPISLVNLKISSHPESSVENYLIETKRIVNATAYTPPKPEGASENIERQELYSSNKQPEKSLLTDKQFLYTVAGVGGILLVIIASIFGYIGIKNGRISAFGLIEPATPITTGFPTQIIAFTDTPSLTSTPSPTITTLPTYTPRPSFTPRSSSTPNLTSTHVAAVYLTETKIASMPSDTSTSTRTPTLIPIKLTNTPEPPTQTRSPTDTPPPPVVIDSCEINPFTVPVGINVTITFVVHFSTNVPGYGFDAVINAPVPNGAQGCSGVDSDGDGIAFCDGMSGELPASSSASVSLQSSVGDCSVSYSSR